MATTITSATAATGVNIAILS
ncbi:hypothetical protein L195_g026442, partial [Trifolium pratense]